MRRLLALAALAGLLLTACAGTVGSSSPGSGDEVYSFTATTASGDPFDGSSLRGKAAVLWFWAPWCPTCRAQAGPVAALHASYGDRVSFVGVGSLDSAESIGDFAAEFDPSFTQIVDPDGAVWKHFGVTAQSTFTVLDSDGAVVASGYLSDDELASTVEELAG